MQRPQYRVYSILSLASALLLLVCPGTNAQQDISGRWQWLGNTTGQTLVLDLKANGRQLSGSVIMGKQVLRMEPFQGSRARKHVVEDVRFAIRSGKIDGNSISFEHDNGNLGTVKYVGVIRSSEITLMREIHMRLNWNPLLYSSSNPNVPEFVMKRHKVEFTVHRVN
jgi:hypothetical protein